MESVRVDKYLQAIRLFKTRSLVAQQCEAGKIKREGKSLKPSTSIKVGDVLSVPAVDDTHRRIIVVKQLLEKRVSAPLAQEAYEDHTPEDVLKEAEEKKALLREQREHRQEGDQGRMTKKQRRLWRDAIHGFKGTE